MPSPSAADRVRVDRVDVCVLEVVGASAAVDQHVLVVVDSAQDVDVGLPAQGVLAEGADQAVVAGPAGKVVVGVAAAENVVERAADEVVEIAEVVNAGAGRVLGVAEGAGEGEVDGDAGSWSRRRWGCS